MRIKNKMSMGPHTCSPGRLLTPFPICVSSQSSCSSPSVPDRLPSLSPKIHRNRTFKIHGLFKIHTNYSDRPIMTNFTFLFNLNSFNCFIFMLPHRSSSLYTCHFSLSFSPPHTIFSVSRPLIPSFSAILSLMLLIRGANSILLS